MFKTWKLTVLIKCITNIQQQKECLAQKILIDHKEFEINTPEMEVEAEVVTIVKERWCLRHRKQDNQVILNQQKKEIKNMGKEIL